MMENETVDVEQARERKSWSAPQMTVVDISDNTENMGNTGNDGAGSFTFS